MTSVMQALIIAAVGLGGVGVYLLMPRGVADTTRAPGIAISSGALVLLWIIWFLNFRQTHFSVELLFSLLGSLTVMGGVMTVTQRNPVASALWFALVVIGTAGLFLLQNAQFIAAAMVIVYAGAIIVMFLFVIMLAHQTGGAIYDRVAREPALAVAASFVMLAILISSSIVTYQGAGSGIVPVPGGAVTSESAVLDTTPTAPQVAGLGRALFADHWLGLEVAGAMLLVAMVGAIVIAGQKRASAPPVAVASKSTADSQ